MAGVGHLQAGRAKGGSTWLRTGRPARKPLRCPRPSLSAKAKV
jgi:hypothetical protein